MRMRMCMIRCNGMTRGDKIKFVGRGALGARGSGACG